MAIKLNEAQLRNLIAKSVKKAIKEEYELGSVGEKVAGDARQDARWEANRNALMQNFPYKNECNQLVSCFNQAMQILNNMDASEYGDEVEEVDWFFHDIFNFLEDYAGRIKRFANGDLSEENLYSEKYSDR